MPGTSTSGGPTGPPLYFSAVPCSVQFAELVATSNAVAQTPGRLKKTDLLATCLRQMGSDERAIGARYLASTVPHKTGIGYATVYEVLQATPPAQARRT